MGYRFEISEARWRSPMTPGRRLTVSTLWKNTGTGRLPFRHYPAFYLLDQKGGTMARVLDKTSDSTQWFANVIYPIKVELKSRATHPPEVTRWRRRWKTRRGCPGLRLASKVTMGDAGLFWDRLA